MAFEMALMFGGKKDESFPASGVKGESEMAGDDDADDVTSASSWSPSVDEGMLLEDVDEVMEESRCKMRSFVEGSGDALTSSWPHLEYTNELISTESSALLLPCDAAVVERFATPRAAS